jgi:hypothetical protein
MLGWITFLLLAIAGLFYVKWLPYYNRAFIAAAHHSVGPSILMGAQAQPPAPSLRAALDYALAYGRAIWQAMVLALLLGSAVQALLPARWIASLLGRTAFGSVVAAGLLALPCMMCTCCAAPVVVGLRKEQASCGASIAFWFGNSVLNPATLVFIGFVLGWNWVALRLGLGLLMVFGVGYLLNRLVAPQPADTMTAELAGIAVDRSLTDPFTRWLRILGFMAARLLPEYLVLVLLLGLMRAWLFPHIGPDIGNQFGWIVLFAIAGTLFVIPTAGEVPIIQAMLALGMGTGPAGALLMTLPPISIPSIALLGRSFQPRVLAFVTLVVVALGVVAGLIAAGPGF